MSSIPPGWLGSIIQTNGAHGRSAVDKQRENVDQADRLAAGEFSGKLKEAIEATDRDSEVYSDAEGSGGQGRSSESEAEQKPGQDDTASDSEAGGLDLQA